MKITSFDDEADFSSDRVQTKVIVETSFSKEIRILLKKGQSMKEHQTPYPIIVHLLSGKVDFGVHGVVNTIEVGDILSLDGGVPHDLQALEDSVIRLSLSKHDKVERVEKVIEE